MLRFVKRGDDVRLVSFLPTHDWAIVATAGSQLFEAVFEVYEAYLYRLKRTKSAAVQKRLKRELVQMIKALSVANARDHEAFYNELAAEDAALAAGLQRVQQATSIDDTIDELRHVSAMLQA